MKTVQASWTVVSLGDLCEIARGGSPRPIKKYITNDSDGVNWIKIGDTQVGGRYIDETKERITKDGIARSRFVEPGSFLLSNSMSFGRPYILRTSGCIHDGWLVLSPDYERVTQDYLYYALSSKMVFNQFDKLATGSTVRNLNSKLVADVEIPLPPLDEQKRIVSILDQAFEGLHRARANAEANLESARELYEASLGSVLSGERDGWTNTNIASLVSAGILEKPLDGNHGEIHPKKSDFQITGIPFIMASDLKNGEVDQENCYFISNAQAETLRKGFAKDGDVLLSHKGTIGRSAILRTSLDYVVLTPQVTYYRVLDKSKLLPDFVYHYFHSSTFLWEMTRIANAGATRAYIGITKQLELPISFPNVIEQQRLVEQFKRMFVAAEDAKSAYKIQLNDLIQLKQSLLQKAFSGELT